MASWVIITTCLLLCCYCRLTHAKASEYQLEEDGLTSCESLRQRAGPQDHTPHCTQDGRFGHVQCSGGGVTCWCVNSQGQEIPGTPTNNSVPHCLSFCRQQRAAVLSEVSGSSASLPECQRSGEFEAVQCDPAAGQCWCVDPDGMELYGTRQNGRPANCPGSCEVRARRFLHTNRGRSPPQCSEDGSFLPVQCKFINTTDTMELDLTNSFNRFPEAFETFTNFRRAFPSVSSYCYCSDSRGREMDNTGVELLLSQVYDTAFRGVSSGPSFSQTNIYRVLQRRLLALRLALTGLFRCPTACEDQRRAAEQVSSAYVPQCESSRGRYSARQCQAGGQQCWCVEPATGTELPGSRRHGDSVVCDAGSASCPAQRRQALSRLFSGPVEPPSRSSSGLPDSSSSSCTELLQPVKDLPGGAPDVPSFVTRLSEVLHGLFPSVGLALEALARSSSSPQRLQENLFGGKFLKNAAALNFSGTVGERGVLAQLAASGADGKENTQLVLLVSRTLESPAFLHALRRTLLGLRSSHSASLEQVLTPLLRSCSGVNDATSAMFVPSCAPDGLYQEVQCDGAQCWCVDPLTGREVAATRTAGSRPARCPSHCEAERARALRAKSAMAAGAELHVPACSSEDGGFLPLQCAGGGARCFCVDTAGRRTTALAAGGAALTCPASTQTLQNRPALCSEALAEVTAFRQEAETIVFLSNSSRLPLGHAFLLAEGLRLTGEELLASQSAEEQARIFDRLLLSRSRSALQLAAYSTLQWYWRRDGSAAESQRPAGYQPYTPQCDQRGDWLSTQCHPSTGQCWCVEEDGQYIPESLTSRSKTLPKCLSRCQRRRVHTLLSGWLKGSDITSDGHNTTGYSARCEESGQFSVLQTEGDAGWCVNPLTGEVLQAATLDPAGQLTCPSWCELQGALCQPDGSFAPFQCDITSCWCVSEDGQEVGGTRRRASVNAPMSCDRPVCPHPIITHGALLCSTPTGGRQSCDLVCHRGYQNALPVGSFLCALEGQRWDANTPLLAAACQRSQAFQTVRSTAEMSLSVDDHQSCSSISSNLTAPLTTAVCSLKLPVSGDWVTVCDDSSVHVQCDSDDIMRLKVTWAASLSDLPTPDLPDLHDVGVFLNGSRLLAALQGLLGNLLPSLMTSEPRLVSMTTPSFGCSPGYRLDTDGAGCVVCPAGTSSAEGACLLCPEGTYQEEEGRDFCRRCPRGSSAIGASSASQCVTSCQRRGLRCSGSGDFLPAQPDIQSGGWRCVSAQGDDLVWTNSNETLSDEQCTVLSRFEAVPGSDLLTGAEDTDILSTLNTDLVACVQACATEPSCHHVAVFTEEEQRQCQLYSTHTLNTRCNTSTQVSGFLGNPETELFDWLSCSPRVRGGGSDLLVVRKKGEEFSVSQHQQQSYERMRMTKALSGVFRTLAFSSSSSSALARGGTSVTDVHRFCQEQCSRDTCCRGFVLNRNVLDGGSVLCGLMGAPSVLQCADEDWDVIGQSTAERVCGAGLTYDQQHRSFVFNFGGQDFTITDASLPADSKNKKDYQASIVTFQAIYLHNGSEPAADVTSPSCRGTQQATFAVDEAVQSGFESLDESSVLVDPKRSLPALSYWLNKMNFNSQQALLWCLSRCRSEQQCSIVDVRQDTAGFHSCLLYPDSTVCGAYDKPLRQPCRPLLPSAPHSAHIKKVDLSGPVKSFYSRVPFQKMVSYSVRSRISLGDTPLSQGFLECERRCDEDPCCRGMGFVRDTKSSGGDVVCLSLISLGVQTCSEDDSATTWTTQDCRPSAVRARPHPFGWYLKPVNQWSKSPALCPPFTLPAPKNNVSVDEWSVVEDSQVTIDPALSAYDVIHVSRDIAGDGDKTRDWCLHACQSVESCKVVTISQTHSATRCVLYPDTTSCVLLSPTPKASSPASTTCRLVVREPASRVYLKKERMPLVTSVAIPGHGTLRGVAVTTSLGGDRKSVVRYLGVPYARAPIGSLRFRPPQPANWTGSWDASKARPSCIQPGDLQSAASSEDCLYLNVFVPVGPVSGPVPVLVFFFNPSANQSPGLLDGSTLSAVGNIVVVTANYRTAALGFLSTGSEELSGNYGLADQEAALRWVKGHASLFGGDGARVTVGAERGGADITSLLLLPSSRPPLFSRMILMGGSVFSPAGVQSVSRSRQQAVQLATELGCVTSDDPSMAACLRQTPAHTLNAAQTKLLAVSGPLQAWSPVVDGVTVSSVHPLDVQTPDLLLGSSAQDGLIGRARRIKDFEVLQGRLDGKTAFYEALSRSLGGEQGSGLVKEAASWLYSLQHSPSPAGYNLFSVALNDATRDMFIVCPSLQMASHWAERRANAFLYHLPESTAQTSADASIPLDVQLVFGTPLQPISSQRFTSTEQRLSLAMMTYFSNFVKTGDPNQAQVSSRAPPAPGLPLWSAVPPPPAPPLYKEVEPELRQLQGLRQQQCSFWNDLAPKLTTSTQTAELGADPVQPVVTPPTLPASQSQTEKDAYN